MNKDIHIGKLIKERFDESNLSVPEFAAALNKSRTTIYDIFSRKSMDIDLLLQISDILNYDFLGKIYELNSKYTKYGK